MASLINCVHWTSLWIQFRLWNLWCRLWVHRYNVLKCHFYPCNLKCHFCSCDFPGGSDSKESACNVRDPGLIPGSGRSPGEENGNPLQYSWLENSIDRGVWQATVHGVTRSWRQLINSSNKPFVPLTSQCLLPREFTSKLYFKKLGIWFEIIKVEKFNTWTNSDNQTLS